MMHNNEREVHVDFFFVLRFPFDSLFRSLLPERNADKEVVNRLYLAIFSVILDEIEALLHYLIESSSCDLLVN